MDKVYDLLKSKGVPHPENVYASRDGYGGQVLEELEIVEADDYIQVNGAQAPSQGCRFFRIAVVCPCRYCRGATLSEGWH